MDEAQVLLNSYYDENPQTDEADRIEKADIQIEKPDIENIKADIQRKLENNGVQEKTIKYVMTLYDKFGRDKIFGRTMVESETGLKKTRVSEILKLLLENDIILPVQGYGKGRYRFR